MNGLTNVSRIARMVALQCPGDFRTISERRACIRGAILADEEIHVAKSLAAGAEKAIERCGRDFPSPNTSKWDLRVQCRRAVSRVVRIFRRANSAHRR